MALSDLNTEVVGLCPVTVNQFKRHTFLGRAANLFVNSKPGLHL